jgi:hypothetical protein
MRSAKPQYMVASILRGTAKKSIAAESGVVKPLTAAF